MVPGHLVAALHGRVDFRSEDHTQLLTNGRAEIRCWIRQESREALSDATGGLSPMEGLRLLLGKKTEACLSVVPSTVNGTDLRVQEWRDSVFLRYAIKSPKLTHHYDICGLGF